MRTGRSATTTQRETCRIRRRSGAFPKCVLVELAQGAAEARKALVQDFWRNA